MRLMLNCRGLAVCGLHSRVRWKPSEKTTKMTSCAVGEGEGKKKSVVVEGDAYSYCWSVAS